MSNASPRASQPPPPASPPPPPPPLPSFRALVKMEPRLQGVQAPHEASWAAADEVSVPAQLLCRMSIASLMGDRQELNADVETSSEGAGAEDGSYSSSSESDTITDTLGGPHSVRTPLNVVTQEKLHLWERKRPLAGGPSIYDDDFSTSDDEDDNGPTRLAKPPPTKQRKTTPKQPTTIAKPRRKPQPKMDATGTLVVYQPTCLDHHNDAHQENRARLGALCGPEGILQRPRFRALRWANLRELKPARLGDILRVHSFQYIQHLEKSCSSLPPQTKACTVGTFYDDGSAAVKKEDGAAADALYPNDWMQTKHAKKCYAAENPPSSGHFDNDSPISRSSYLAARLAAGAVCHAIDKVVRGETRNAFVAVRPPGHHAGPNGCVESEGFHRRPEMCTCGFCLLNNVAIGAAYAMATYGGAYYHDEPTTQPQIERIAIIDFDIHHGNGTEEILRNLVPHQQRYPLPSSWAPLTFPSYKPWRDERDVDNVFFASIHLHDGDNFYPCSGAGPKGDSAELREQQNIMNLPLDFIGPRYLEDRERLTQKAKKSLMERASRAFRERFSKQLIPALREFRPDLVLLSAGFDGHADDFYYFLTETDYEWMTEQLAAVADEYCDGRLVSVLEGGYNVELSAQQKRKLKAKYKGKKRPGPSSTTTSPAASPARSTRTEGEEDEEEDDESGAPMDEDEQIVYGSLARSCAAHVMALQRAGAKK